MHILLRDFFVNNTSLSLAVRVWRHLLTSTTYWMFVCGTALLLSLAGAFDTDNVFSVLEIISYWMIVIVVTSNIGFAFTDVSDNMLLRSGYNRAFSMFASQIACSPVNGVLVHLFTSYLVGAALTDVDVFIIYGSTFAVGVSVAAIMVAKDKPLLLHPGSECADQFSPKENEEIGAAFFSRLSSNLGTDVIFIQSQDHYLFVKTTKGTETVLMRLGDACKSLEGIGGLQVHRSWWVNFRHADYLKGTVGQRQIYLMDGTAVPVGRKFDLAARQAFETYQTELQRSKGMKYAEL